MTRRSHATASVPQPTLTLHTHLLPSVPSACQVFGSWVPVLAANLFFLLGALLQRAAMGPVAQRVAMQEAAEGAYRTSHARLLAWGPEVALYR
jgi:ABC-type uncharacterized transport system fused permease/ATPase subunit